MKCFDMLILEGCSKQIESTIVMPIGKYIKNYLSCPDSTLKDSLCRVAIRAEQSSSTSSEFEFHMLEEDYYSSILCDFSLFFSRAYLQRATYSKCGTRASPSWRFVTLYYMAFFSATALTRLFSNGFIYIDNNTGSRLSSILTSYAGIPTVINRGNYEFRKKTSVDPIILLKQSSKSTHEATWNFLLNIFQANVFKTSHGYEKEFYRELIGYMKSDNYPPSMIRNYINYETKICIHEIRNMFYFYHNADLSNEDIEDLLINNLVASSYNKEEVAAIFFDFIYRYTSNIYEKFYACYLPKNPLSRALSHFKKSMI